MFWLANAPDLGFQNRDLKAFLFISKNDRFARGKCDFSHLVASSQLSNNVVILAQILVQHA
jgi:hypothetical protein